MAASACSKSDQMSSTFSRPQLKRMRLSLMPYCARFSGPCSPPTMYHYGPLQAAPNLGGQARPGLWQRHVHAGSHAVILPDKAGAAAHVRRLCGHALLLLPCMGGNPTRTAAKTRLVPVGDDGGLFDEGLDAAQGGRNVGQPHAVHKLGRAPQVRSHLRMQGSPSQQLHCCQVATTIPAQPLLCWCTF